MAGQLTDKKMSLSEAVATTGQPHGEPGRPTARLTIDGDSIALIYDFLAIAVYLTSQVGERVSVSRAMAWTGSTITTATLLPGAVGAFVLDFDMNPDRYPRVLRSI